MKTKPLLAAIAVAAAAVGGYWYYSPYLVLKSMHEAAQRKDADAFNERVDYPKLRESLKGQFEAMMAEKVGATENGLAAFGVMLGTALVSPMVDALVRPEAVMRAMRNGAVKQEATAPSQNAQPETEKKPVQWALERKGFNKVFAYRQQAGKEADKDFGVVLERSGFADWKLTEIRLASLR